MRASLGIRIPGIVLSIVCASTGAVGGEPRNEFLRGDIASVRIDLNPRGARLGFALEVPGDDPRLKALLAVIRSAENGKGHKCANVGAVRFTMTDGSVVAVGLLPSHEEGRYDLRWYDGNRLVTVYRVDRADLLASLEILGVPANDPAFED